MKSVISVTRATRTASLVITLDGGEPNQPFRIDWGDGTAIQTLASGAHAGPTTHVYAAPGKWTVSVQGNDLRTTESISVGDQLRAWDPDKYTKTPKQMQEREARKAAQIAGQVKSGSVGGS